MSSILTNNGAMTALQTLKSINNDMSKTQSQISTGKDVATAKDNSAVWAISKVMEADVQGFKAISDSLALGESTVAVGRNAAETVTDLLTEIKGKIVAAQEENVDTAKIQEDISALTNQISSVVDSAQFNGLNLVNGTAESPVKVTSSLDRGADGVSPRTIDVQAQDLSQRQQVVDDDATTADYAAGTTVNQVANSNTAVELTMAEPTAGVAYSLNIAGTDDGTASGFDPTTYNAGGALADAGDIAYVAKSGDTAADVAAGLAAAYAAYAADNSLDTTAASGLSITADGDKLSIVSDAGDTAADEFDVAVDTVTSDENEAAGDLAALDGIDVKTKEGAAAALENIEGLIQSSINAASSFGSVENRISIQNDFVGKLMDSMKSGIGSLVDADMEETSARLQALQVQQQLGVQSLSIANQAPQSLLSLFR